VKLNGEWKIIFRQGVFGMHVGAWEGEGHNML